MLRGSEGWDWMGWMYELGSLMGDAWLVGWLVGWCSLHLRAIRLEKVYGLRGIALHWHGWHGGIQHRVPGKARAHEKRSIVGDTLYDACIFAWNNTFVTPARPFSLA